MTFVRPFGAPAWTVNSSSQHIMDATTDFCGWQFEAQGTTPIAKLRWFVATKTGTPDNLGVVITADNNGVPNIVASVPVDIGGGSPTLVSLGNASITNNAVNTATFTNAFTPTAGTRYWVVLYPLSGGGSGWSASHRYIHEMASANLGSGSHEFGATSTDSGTNWSILSGIQSFSLLDGSDNYLPTMLAACFGSATFLVSYGVGSNPDEYGNLLTVPMDATLDLHGLHYLYRITDAVNADHTLFAYTDPLGSPTLLESMAVDVSTFRPTINTNFIFSKRFTSGPYTLTGGTALSLSARCTGTGNLQIGPIVFESQAAREAALLLRDLYGVTREGGSGAFTATLDRINQFLPLDEVLGTAGGGAPYHGAMAGGMLV